ncbi:MAG: TrbG/VirB9 family P-type conjugative transfer protein [Phenylobacterium sp.]|uniref:TrbG/VirB9 family P-type conjugative transfer protein n=1 Tax=Phenylobacterium sp. TaxID=1871053 RepID=UPI00271FB5B7|nr:TrbG/VirB9 family P-type conjugative transfer protein [Phenylobacterium sp.]MDO8911220.1 TrbG/VirB9 family P-type conjugative transfer protein [Phenylobacterium sp.]MDP3100763.1 TrbG/VirB9 family P-type conjugative transfer protein [Phenylobacterium sp.]
MRATLALALAMTTAPLAVEAAQVPRPGPGDPHIQSVEYDPDQVVLLNGVVGYQLMLEFAPDERLVNVSIGDSLGWQVTPNRNANLLFLKPIDKRAVTNMTVVTNQRRYAFDLRVSTGPSLARTPYVVRFIYPQVAVAAPAPEWVEPPPEVVNAAYVVTGAAESAPVQVFDDGRMTYFAWAPQAAAPAIFAVAADGAESLVNYGVRGGYTVVEQLAPRFMLRNGKQVATVTNQAYRAAAPDQRTAAK